VEISVGTELNHSTVMILVWLRHDKQHALFDSIPILGNDGCTIGPPGVVHEEAAVSLELRMECEAPQSSFVTRKKSRTDFRKQGRRCGLRLKHENAARLLDNKSAPGPVLRVGEEDRLRSVRDDRDKGEPGCLCL